MPEFKFISLDEDYSDEIWTMRHYTDEVDLSEFTEEEIEVIRRFIYKFPDYTAIIGMHLYSD